MLRGSVRVFQLTPTKGQLGRFFYAVHGPNPSFYDIANTSPQNPETLIPFLSSTMSPKLASSIHFDQISVLHYLVFGAIIDYGGHHP